MKRIFIAIKISPQIQQKADEWASEFSTLPVRWVRKENLHITLIPPWEEENIEKIIEKVGEIQGKIIPFDVNFYKITYGPNPFNPRLIWAEGGAAESLARLQREIAKSLDTKPLDRKFKTHLTLARFRPENFFHFPIKSLDEQIDWMEKVNSICVVESILKSSGAEYLFLKNIKL